MFIACKYEEIYPIKLKIFYEKISHKRLSTELILKTESKIMTMLNFDLSFTNVWEFCGALATEFRVANFSKYLEKLNYFCRMIVHDPEFLKKNNPIEVTLAMFDIVIGDKDFSEMNAFKVSSFTLSKENAEVSDKAINEKSKMILKFKANFETDFPNLKSLEKFSKC